MSTYQSALDAWPSCFGDFLLRTIYTWQPGQWLKESPSLREFALLVDTRLVLKDRCSCGCNNFSFALLKAVKENGVILAEILIRKGVCVNAKDSYNGRTALHHAAHRGDEELCCLLVANGATFNTGDSTGDTPLHLAAREGHVDVVSMLLDMRTDMIEARGRSGATPLLCASLTNRLNVVQLLLQRGAKVNTADDERMTPLHAAQGHDMVTLLLQHGANALKKDIFKATTLHSLIRDKNIGLEVIERMVEAGVDVNDSDVRGRTPLHIAAAGGHVKAIESLLAHGAVLEARAFYYKTPLWIACEHTQVCAVERLLDCGANYRIAISSMSILRYLMSTTCQENGPDTRTIVKLLASRGATMTTDEEGKIVAACTGRTHKSFVLDIFHLYLQIKCTRNAMGFVKCTASADSLQPLIRLPPEMMIHVYRYVTEGTLSIQQIDQLCKVAVLGVRSGVIDSKIVCHVVDFKG